MSQLVPSGYYSVNPMNESKVNQLLGLLGDLGLKQGQQLIATLQSKHLRACKNTVRC